MKPIKVIIGAALLLALAACGTPTTVTLHNLGNATPNKILELPSINVAAQPTTVPDVSVPTSAAQPTLAPQNASATPFVLLYELYGTPTPTRGASQPSQPTKAANQPTNPPTKVAAQPTQASTIKPTLPPTATKPVTPQPTVPAAGGGDAVAVKGDPVRGKSVFNSAGCAGCHDVSTGGTLVGPSLKGVGPRAATRKPPMSASDYLHESIKTPNAFVVKGFTAGVMVQNYGQTLKDSQIDDLVAYLLSLK